MARRTQTYAIRLAVEGGGQVKAELVSIGQRGEQSLKRIESAGDRASGGLKGLGRQAELLRTGIRTLGGALAGVATVGGLAALVDRSSRLRMRSARLPTRSGSASRPCRNCVSQRRHPGSSSRLRHGAAALHPPRGRGGAGHGRGQGRTGADGHCAARPERQPAAQCRRTRSLAPSGLRRGSPARSGARSRGFIWCRATCCGWCRPSATSTSIRSDWRRDFTVRLRRAELNESLARSGPANERLTDHRLDVRGYPLKTGR